MNDWTTSHDRVLAQRQADGWMFLIDVASHLWTTTVLAPRDRALARLLTGPVRLQASRRPPAVLHTGASGGSVIRALMSRLPDGSRLDVVEADHGAAGRLRGLVAGCLNSVDTPRQVQVQVHETDIERFATAERYDVIVCGLPLTALSPVALERAMARHMELLRPGGTLTYSAGIGPARAVPPASGNARCHAVGIKVMDAYQRSYAIGRRTVWAGWPPARVWHLQRPSVSLADQPLPRDGGGR
ncbi:translation initiation factor IF-2 [Streptomyces canus]|uniref:class I SAM-dependent methyltransferase n=1 Tax=Streptomyces TaxID=1883 RepID=UPI0033A11798